MKKIAVIYHLNCPDGFGAAWVAYQKFGKKADYFGVPPRGLPEESLDNYLEIYILDNSFTTEVSMALIKAGKKVIIIDHHASSEEDIKRASEFVFDTGHSGAVLTWKYFYPKQKTPWLLKYIEDGDLWNLALPKTDAIRAYLGMIDLNFANFSKLVKKFETIAGRSEAAKEGCIIHNYRDALVKAIAKSAYHVEFMGYTVLAVNSNSLISDVGGYLAEMHPPFAIIWSEHGVNRRYSLRSTGKVDVSKLAAEFPRGGGHPNAAGFSLPASKPFPWKLAKHHHDAK
jgi:oligoribonuclease NrnB/cAMP/cGMP phosphodiesterase (DHH superfamily)